MSHRRPTSRDNLWRDRPNPVHDERVEREARRAIANEKRAEITRFPYDSVVSVAEFISNLRVVAGQSIGACEKAANAADDEKDAQFHRAEAGYWRGVRAACKMIEKGSTMPQKASAGDR